jgi:hypothetical protein
LDASRELSDKVSHLFIAVQSGKEDEIKRAIDAVLESNKR